MKISTVQISNFRPYFGNIQFDLRVEENKNIILIGGRNGHGKTSFLLAIVWCLYGKNITSVDEIFRKEVKGNYSKFLSNALNQKARNNGTDEFSIEITLEDVALSQEFTINEQELFSVTVKRSYNTQSLEETFDILLNGEQNSLISDEEMKVFFINDYILPIDIAKFVFFDAEKISDIAQLGAKEQANFMNEAFGQVLGLNVYENLMEDITEYSKKLRRQLASPEIELQLSTFESSTEINNINIQDLQKNIDENEDRVDELKSQISDLTNELIKRGDPSIRINVKELREKEKELAEKHEDATRKFQEASDLIALTILGPKLEEVLDQVHKEEDVQRLHIEKEVLNNKTKELAEKIFNSPPFPEEDIDLEQKIFYYKKAKSLLKELNTPEAEEVVFDFEHNLDKSEVEHLEQVLDLIKPYSQEFFTNIFEQYIRVVNDYNELQKQIRIGEANNQDEFIQDIIDQKNTLEREYMSLIEKNGQNKNKLEDLKAKNQDNKQKIERFLKKVQVNKVVDKKIQEADKYLKVLNKFIQEQKEIKRSQLENNLKSELSSLFSKQSLFEEVSITLHKSNIGMEINLFSSNGNVSVPSTWSKGEQQLYISALIKSILSESIFELPVLIDTPLGRLDQEHRNNLLTKYYPSLSEQVVIFSTDTEIRKEDLFKIEQNVSKMYLLQNIDGDTHLINGYF